VLNYLTVQVVQEFVIVGLVVVTVCGQRFRDGLGPTPVENDAHVKSMVLPDMLILGTGAGGTVKSMSIGSETPMGLVNTAVEPETCDWTLTET